MFTLTLIDQATGFRHPPERVETLAECFPDDPDGLAHAVADLATDGAAFVGGGAGALFEIKPEGRS